MEESETLEFVFKLETILLWIYAIFHHWDVVKGLLELFILVYITSLVIKEAAKEMEKSRCH